MCKKYNFFKFSYFLKFIQYNKNTKYKENVYIKLNKKCLYIQIPMKM